MMITFKEHSDDGYAGRTATNASADVTIAIASNFNSAGEKLTKKLVEDKKKVYVPIDISMGLPLTPDTIETVAKKLNSALKGNLLDNAISLNIAGNGLYTLKNKYSQKELDNYVLLLLTRVIESPLLKAQIKSIQSGGQSGLDEAGAKAGVKLNIPTTVICPKGWKYRTGFGEDITDEDKFKSRFL